MAEVTTEEETSSAHDFSDSDDVIAKAVRGELAEKLNLAPQTLDDLSPEAAARTLDHLNDITRRLDGTTDDEAMREPRLQDIERRDVVARALRDELADKLRIHPRLLRGLRAEAAAATLARVNESTRRLRVIEGGGQMQSAPTGVITERRDVVSRVIRDELALELEVHPRSLVQLSPELAATTLSHLSQVNRRLRRLENQVSGETPAATSSTAIPDRRDMVARTIRDALAERLNLEPAALGPITPRAGGEMLLHLQATTRRVRELEQRIAVDELTGVLRRAAGQEALEREVDRARRGDSRLVLAFIDVDHLKPVNDTEGHTAGDDLLKTVAATLRSRLRRYDVVIRWGGDEFVCVLPQTDVEGARRIFDEIEAAYRSRTGGKTFSVGFASLQEHDDVQQLLDRADLELYGRKRERREQEQAAAAPVPAEAATAEPADTGGSEVAPNGSESSGPKPQPLWKRWTAIG